jgi:SRSO17 transposase
MEGEFAPEAHWIIDEVSFPKQGKHSVGVARQYCGALGKTASCQVAVTLDLGTEETSTPLDWALYLPEQWINDPVRREKAGIPKEVTFKTKTELALDLIDEVRGWGLQDRLVLADSAYGDAYDFRQGLRSRELDYVVQVRGELTAWTENPHPPEPPMKQRGKPRKRLYAKELPASRNLSQIAKDLPSQSWKTITWREGTKGPLCSRFARVVVWMANGLVQGKTMQVPAEELLIEWPEGNQEPSKYWLSSLPPQRTSWRGLVRTAKGRFRIEQDYEEMKGELGLDHFEGRSWQGWHHHVTLVTLAYASLILERMGNKKNFWIDLAGCPPMDPEILTDVYRHMSDLWK